MQTSGVILDIYDDLKGRVLREKLAGKQLPEKLKSASLLSPDELSRIPDRLFAIVAEDGMTALRKYAMHDEGHLTTSIIYFLECGHLFPKEAQDVAAQNLAAACDWYDVVVPEPLAKRAGLGGKAMGALGLIGMVDETKSGMEKKRGDMDRFRAAQATGMSYPKTSADEDALETLLFTEEKKADLTGTEMMTHQETNRGARVTTRRPKGPALATSSKNAGLQFDFVDPHVNITGLSAPVVKTAAAVENYALGTKYPIDTYGQVKQAEAYFEEHSQVFNLPERRSFAVSLVKRANDLGVPVTGRVLDYAGFGYGPHIMAELQKRANNYAFGQAAKVATFEDLKEKVASGVSPNVIVTALVQADTFFGLEGAYNKPVVGFRDPFAAVYGIKTAKEQVTGVDDSAAQKDMAASRSFAWNEGSDYVTEDMLHSFAASEKKLDEMFGDGFGKSFSKDPVGVFKSLPDPQKHAVARMASDNSGGSFRSS